MSTPLSNPDEQNNQISSFQQAPQPVTRNHPPATFRQINPSSSQQAPHMHQNVSPIPQTNNAIPEASPELMMRRRLAAAANPQQNQSAGFGLVQQQDMLAYLQHHAQLNLQGQNVKRLGPHHQQLSSQRQQQTPGQNVNLLASNHQHLSSQRQPQHVGQNVRQQQTLRKNVNLLAPNHQQLSSQRQPQNVGQNVNPLALNQQQLMSRRQPQTLGQNVNRLASNQQKLSSQRQLQNVAQNVNTLSSNHQQLLSHQRQQQNFGQNGNPLASNHQQLSSQRQQQTFGQNVNLSGPHHVQSSQGSMVTTQQQTLYRQMNTSQVQMMQMPQTQKNGQQTHQMTGMPASILSSGTGEIYRKVQILKTNYAGRLTSIYQKLNICLRNLDKQNVRKFEVVKIHQLVRNTLKILDKMENNIARITDKNLDDIENRIKFILVQFADKKPVSTSAQQENSSVNVHAMSQQSVQLDSQTAQARTNQDKMMQLMQAGNQKFVETNMQQRHVTNSMTGSRPPILQSGTQHLQRSLAIKDSNQTSLSGNSTMPTHSPWQQSVKIPSHGQVSASDENTLEPRITQPKQMHLKQPLLQQNPQPVRPHSEAFPSPLAQNHGSSGQQVARSTSQCEKNSLPVPQIAPRNPLNHVTPPPRFSPLDPKDTPPIRVNSERPMSDAALNSSVGNIGDAQVTAPAEAPSPSTSLAPKDTSPVSVNSERPKSDAALHSSCVGIIRDEQAIAPPVAPSPSTTLPEKPNDIHSEKSTVNSDEVPPIQRLIKAISSMSDQALAGAASDIASVVYEQYDRFGMKRPRWNLPYTDAESETCHKMKRPRLVAKEIIAEEIKTIYQKLLQTVLKIGAPSAEYGEGTTVTCCFLGKYFIPGLKASPEISLQMLVPADYPSQSPKILGSCTVYKAAQARHEPEDLSAKVMSKVIRTLRTFDSPFSLQQIAFAWDRGAQEVICESEQQDGKGSSLSIGKGWEYFTVANPK